MRPGPSTGSYTTLSPRTSLAAVPYTLGLMPGAVVSTSEVNVPAITVSAPYSNSNALVATGTGDGYTVIYSEDASAAGGFGVFGKSAEGTAVYGEAAEFGTGVEGKGYRGMEAEGTYTGIVASGLPMASTPPALGASGSMACTQAIRELTPVWRARRFRCLPMRPVRQANSAEPTLAPSSTGVLGYNEGLGASGIGVWGEQWGTGYGVYGSTRGAGYGVVGQSPSPGYAGWFIGHVNVTGTLSKGGGSFKIDHPLDPANKYLVPLLCRSPDMMNIYNGMPQRDATGVAIVTLPDWFEALNRTSAINLPQLAQPCQTSMWPKRSPATVSRSPAASRAQRSPGRSPASVMIPLPRLIVFPWRRRRSAADGATISIPRSTAAASRKASGTPSRPTRAI